MAAMLLKLSPSISMLVLPLEAVFAKTSITRLVSLIFSPIPPRMFEAMSAALPSSIPAAAARLSMCPVEDRIWLVS